MAEYVKRSPIVCDQLVKKNAHASVSLKSKESRKYFFDLNRAYSIFGWLRANKRIWLKSEHKFSKSKELIGKKYYKWPNSYTYSINDCVVFRNVVQDLVESKELIFPNSEEVIGVNEDPFPLINDMC